jgi:hypothetical protein
MTDNQLSTRDLATRSEGDPDGALETEQSADRHTGTGPAGAQDSGLETTQTDASLTRDPGTDQALQTGRTAEGGEPLSSAPEAGVDTDQEPLFASDQSERFTTRWQEIQTSFVDQPRNAVAEADTLVADLMQRLAASFSQERERLETQWDRGDDVSTEDLRVALTRYRSFFDRLLSA